jgi:imidazolonepropionase-like amidohydrolase
MAVADSILIRGASLVDPALGEVHPDRSILVEGDNVREVGGPELDSPGSEVVDARGMFVMPGLIDCHVHVTAVTADLAAMASWAPSYVTARAAHVLSDMLQRGFTTVRDVAGADFGLAAAIDERYLTGPRLIFGGKALSQTGGHGDWRSPGQTAFDPCYCCSGLGVICDGVAEVRRAARDEIRKGAHHVKLMVSGGVASPTDRVDSTQFADEEIRAAVEEAEAANIYVTAHAYTSRAINRALKVGVRTIEHGNLMDDSSLPLFEETGAFYVPTLATYSSLAARGIEFGLPEASHRKVFDVLESGLHALELAHEAGIPIAYGTDLLGGMHEDQLTEFEIRSQVQSPEEILRSATTVAARLLRMEGKVGTISAGSYADLLVVDRNPFEDVRHLTNPGERLRLIMARGTIVKNLLQT